MNIRSYKIYSEHLVSTVIFNRTGTLIRKSTFLFTHSWTHAHYTRANTHSHAQTPTHTHRMHALTRAANRTHLRQEKNQWGVGNKSLIYVAAYEACVGKYQHQENGRHQRQRRDTHLQGCVRLRKAAIAFDFEFIIFFYLILLFFHKNSFRQVGIWKTRFAKVVFVRYSGEYLLKQMRPTTSQ